MSSCEFAHLDGVYVLGALAAGERAEYERHLSGCEECSRALRDLAGIPGLLGRVPLEVLEQSEHPEPAPETLLPAVVAEARRSQGRRRALTATIVAAASVLLVLALTGIGVALLDDDNGKPVAAPTASVSTAPSQRMQSLGTESSGWVSLTERGWGTRIDLTCTYEGKLEGWTSYVMVVTTSDGTTEQVGSWRTEPGKEVHVTMATSVVPDDIASVEVRTDSGYSVLRLTE
jgi:hypothetical protein